MCNCANIAPQSQECYDQMITLPIPEHMASYKEARTQAGLSDLICIDPCIVLEIQDLWSLGITTYGCCCGHNKVESFVNVAEWNIDEMLSMGYIQNHWEADRKDTFKLKTV